ncbi:MAG: M15 family metallopeptidase [Methyloceanibacter sp.]
MTKFGEPRSMRLALSLACLASAALSSAGAPALAAEMPKDFVYLRDIDPTILQDMRYAGRDNFTGEPVPGYDAPECVLLRPAAEALASVQADLRAKGLTLKVYDCYRPARAVAAFVEWAKEADDPAAKATYYPNLPKSALFPDYIATRSGHSRGATLDLTIVMIASEPEAETETATPLPCTAPQQERGSDGSLDMGTSFDCFDVEANTAAPGLSPDEQDNRATLLEAMRARGFKNYPLEWWHFTFEPEPYPDTIFDFPIVPRP